MAKLPPGPRINLIQTARYARDPYGYMIAMQRKYGDPFTVPTLNGVLVLTGEPSSVQQIFSADPDTFLPFGSKAIEPALGKNSLLAISGAQHRRDRKLLTPPLHGARMRAYGHTIRQAARAAMARWQVGQPFVMQTATQWISLEVILRAVFGVQEPTRGAALEATGQTLVVYEVPLLFENNLEKQMKAVILVCAPDDQRVARVMARDRLSPEDVRARMAARGSSHVVCILLRSSLGCLAKRSLRTLRELQSVPRHRRKIPVHRPAIRRRTHR